MGWAWCNTDFSNYWPQEVAHPEDIESLKAYKQWYVYEGRYHSVIFSMILHPEHNLFM